MLSCPALRLIFQLSETKNKTKNKSELVILPYFLPLFSSIRTGITGVITPSKSSAFRSCFQLDILSKEIIYLSM